MKKSLNNCPHCGGEAKLILESKVRAAGRTRQAKIRCINNKRLIIPRCYAITVLAPVDEVIWHWDRKDIKDRKGGRKL